MQPAPLRAPAARGNGHLAVGSSPFGEGKRLPSPPHENISHRATKPSPQRARAAFFISALNEDVEGVLVEDLLDQLAWLDGIERQSG